jgi:pimeloyl-ACP methyl ester carboxylesterase
MFICPGKDKVTESTTLIILAHGNAMKMQHMLPYVEDMVVNIHKHRNKKTDNYHAAVFEYPGYGCHRNPSTDDPDSFIQSCVDVIEYARTEQRYHNIILFGHSLGAAVVLGACAQLNHIQSPTDVPWVQGCVTYGAFSSVRDMAAKFLRSHTEAGWFTERFDNCSFLSKISSIPVHLIHGQNDKLIPISQARKLYTYANSSLIQLHETHGGHNDIHDDTIVNCILSI